MYAFVMPADRAALDRAFHARFTEPSQGAVMAVTSPRVTSLAIGQEITPEELGGWKLHTDVTGLVDAAYDTDEEVLDAVRTFLSYLPSHAGEAPA